MPTLEQMAELYIAMTDNLDDIDESTMQARQESFQILIDAGSRNG